MRNIHMIVLVYAQYSDNSIAVCSIFLLSFCCMLYMVIILLLYAQYSDDRITLFTGHMNI